MRIEEIKQQAINELVEENKRMAIDMYKAKLRAKKWWHKLIPFKIVIIRR